MCCLRINEMSAGSREHVSLGVCAIVTEGKVSILFCIPSGDMKDIQSTVTNENVPVRYNFALLSSLVSSSSIKRVKLGHHVQTELIDY